MARLRKKELKATPLYLPDECWENIVKFVVNDQPSLESLSLVSKQLLCVTNRSKFSLSICDDQALNPYLPHLFRRFPNITSLNFIPFRKFNRDSQNLDAILCQISNYPLQLKSLDLSNHYRIPSKGFKALAKKLKTPLKSLICSNIVSLNHTDLEHIANCFPFLEELDLHYHPDCFGGQNLEFKPVLQSLSLALPNLCKFNLSRNCYITDSSLLQLFKNCVFLEEVVMPYCNSLTIDGIASAIRERPNLKSFFIGNGRHLYMHHNSQLIHSLVSLEDLNCLDLSTSRISDGLLSSITKESLPWRKLRFNGCFCFDLTYNGIFSLLCKCQFLQHLDFRNICFLTDQHVADLSLILGKLLLYINVSYCGLLTDSAMFALLRNCPLLGEIRMVSTRIGKCNVVKDCNSVNPHHRVMSLDLGSNAGLNDESIKFYASIFPNLELLT